MAAHRRAIFFRREMSVDLSVKLLMMKTLTARDMFWLLAIVACVTIIPFLGLADFHTKGEPREAVVAYSMLESGDWLLPRNNGGCSTARGKGGRLRC